jgi:hypothetical protein
MSRMMKILMSSKRMMKTTFLPMIPKILKIVELLMNNSKNKKLGTRS